MKYKGLKIKHNVYVLLLLLMAIIMIVGCAADDDDDVTFPSGFIGTWERDDQSSYRNTLTFTSTTLTASNQSGGWKLKSVHDDAYTIVDDHTSSNSPTITIKLIDGNLEISNDNGTGQNNWNGIWKKQ